MEHPQPSEIYLSAWYYATRLACLTVVGLFVGVALFFVTEGKVQTLVVGVAAFGVTIGFILSVIFLVTNAKGIQKVKAMIDSQRVIVWGYTRDEWEAYLRKETLRKSQRLLILFLVFTLMGAGISGLIYLEERARDFKMLMPAMIGFLIGFVIYSTVKVLGFGAHRRLRSIRAWFVMGANGFYITGSFYSWRSLGRDLVATRLIENSEIDFAFQVRSNGQNYDYTFRIPIPESAQPDMPKIVQFLTENPELRFVP